MFSSTTEGRATFSLELETGRGSFLGIVFEELAVLLTAWKETLFLVVDFIWEFEIITYVFVIIFFKLF